MRTIMVTGGAGFIGSCLVRKVVRERLARVVNLDKLTYSGNRCSLESVLHDSLHEFVHGDIGDHELVERLLRVHRPSAIVNLAAESHVDRSIDGAGTFIETNVNGTCQLLQAARAYWCGLDEPLRSEFRFLHISTDEVFGSLGPSGRFTENSPYAPSSPYSASKAASDHLVRAFHLTYGLPTITVNCSNNYGPFQYPEKLIPLMILNALERKPLPLFGDGLQVRDWLFVEDHCEALLTALEHAAPGETYNIGGNCERTNLSIVQTLCRIIDELCPEPGLGPRTDLITLVEDRPGHDRRYAVDAGKARRELGWQPTQDVLSGLRRTVQWYLDNTRWAQRVTAGRYGRERLGLNV